MKTVGKTFAVIAMAIAICTIPVAAFGDFYITLDDNALSEGTAASSEDGTWEYDGANTLILNGYTGERLTIKDSTAANNGYAVGEETQAFNIVLKGENSLESDRSAVSAGNVNLNITSDDENASLSTTTNSEATDYHTDGKRYYCFDRGAISVTDGSLNIVKTTVNAIWNTNSTSRVPNLYGRDEVTGAITAYNSNINIVDSVVSAVVNADENVGSDVDGSNLKYAGIAALDYSGASGLQKGKDGGGNISIDNSTVSASSPDFSIVALAASGDGSSSGTISITNSAILFPKNGKVVDVVFDRDQFYPQTDEKGYDYATFYSCLRPGQSLYGQTIAYEDSDDVITSIDDSRIASSAVIGNDADGKTEVPKTSDNAAGVVVLTFALLMLGAALVCKSMFGSMR